MRLGYLLPLSLATLSCAASEHIARRVATPIEENTDEAIRELQLSPSDRQAVFGDTAIIKRLRVTDCHASISKQLEGRCKSEKDQIDPNEAFRSDLAISLTLCSLASAMQTIPSDCESWYRSEARRESAPSWKIWRNTPEIKSQSARSACLGALHRSPQDWTSYNQYLSDATLLCSALRADWQMSRARELYANATMEKISLITLLRTNEEGRREEETRLIKDMFDGVRQTRHNAETMGETLELIQQEVSRQETLRHSMIMEIKQVMEGLSRTRDVLWDEVRLEGTGIALSLIQDIRRSHDEMIRSLAHQLQSSMSRLSVQHGDSLDEHSRRLGVRTESMVSRLSESFALLAGETKMNMDAFNDKLAASSMEAAVLQGNVAAAARLIHDIHPALLSSVESASAIRNHHNQTLFSLVESRSAALNLSAELERSLVIISRTMAMAHKSNGILSWAWVSPSLFSLSAFTIPEASFSRSGLLNAAASAIVGVVRGVLGVFALTLQLLGISIGMLLSVSTTIYAALHSGARYPIRRFLRRLTTQINKMTDDLKDDTQPAAAPRAKMLEPISKSVIPEWKDVKNGDSRSRAIAKLRPARIGLGDNPGQAVPRNRIRCVSVPL